jgi:hypothetical protein
VALFQGHTPALPSDEPKASSDQVGPLKNQHEPAKLASWWGNSLGHDSALDVKGPDSCSDDFLSTANFGSFNFSFGQLDEFVGNPSENSFAMVPPDHFLSAQKKGGD